MKNIFTSIIISGAMILTAACCTDNPSATTLKEAYSDSFMIGCAVNPLHTGGRLEQARNLILEHFNAISPENCLKPEAVQPRPGVWTFEDADEFVQFGEDNGLKAGIGNLQKHIENIKQFNLTPVVAINRFTTDAQEEIDFIKQSCAELGVECALAEVWAKGGEGAIELAEKVVKAVDASLAAGNKFVPMYELTESVEAKIEKISKKIYGAEAVDYTPKAKADLKKIYDLGLQDLAICMAKTQKSLSDNPALLGRPKDFIITVREIEIAAGAGFLIPITGEIMRMPGLPETPASEAMDITTEGEITGLF